MRLFILGTAGLFVAAAQVQIPTRPSEALFKGAQGKQRPETLYDPATGTVTMKVLVQDPNGYFIPSIRPENFAVYENGVRQNNVSVTVEHAPITVGLLLEHGGRQPALARDMNEEVIRAARQWVDLLGSDDAAAIWTYADSVKQLSDFTKDRQALTLVVYINPPDVSETNLYDALIFVTSRMRQVPGRKAIVVLSSGIDTFSKATYDDALKAARQSDTPIYIISLAQVMQEDARLHGLTELKMDWTGSEKRLQEIAAASGGRLYSPPNTIDLSVIYGDIIENVKSRYVITYQSSNRNSPPGTPRTVRVELVEAGTTNALRITDAKGQSIRARVIAETSYTPEPAQAASGRKAF